MTLAQSVRMSYIIMAERHRELDYWMNLMPLVAGCVLIASQGLHWITNQQNYMEV